MRPSVCLYQVGVGVAVLLLPLKIGGCGNTACITVTSAQLAQNAGACPSPAAALMLFSGSPTEDPVAPAVCQQGGGVSSVDGPGSFDGPELCCYPVDLMDNGGEEACGTSGESVAVGSGVFSGSSGGGGDVGSSTVASGPVCTPGFGGSPGPGCGGGNGAGGAGGFLGMGGAPSGNGGTGGIGGS